jgi:hypothetical protein
VLPDAFLQGLELLLTLESEARVALGGASFVGEVCVAAERNVELLPGGGDVEPGEAVGLELRDGAGIET